MYSLIHDSGYECYYEKQDRVGQPISGREVNSKGLSTEEFWSVARGENGCFETTLYISGMTCRGCSWLVQQIASREPHVLTAAVSLVSGRMELRHEKDFDFPAFQERLSHFAYGLSASAGFGGPSLSPILVRMIMTGTFALNGGLLTFAMVYQIGGESLEVILSLLAVLNLMLLMLIGGGVFLKAAWDGLRFRQLHLDSLPALALVVLGVLSLGEIVSLLSSVHFSILLFVLLPVLMVARVLGDLFESRVRREDESEPYA